MRKSKTWPLLVVVGMPGAGKSTVVQHIAERGWPIVYFGGITLAEAERRGLEPTPERERLIREDLRGIHGDAAYAELSLPRILEHLGQGPTVIDGLYSWAEYKLLRERVCYPIHVIAVCADRELRYERLARRNTRPLTRDEAEARDFAEIEKIQKGGPIAMADFTLLNNGSREQLEHDVDTLMARLLESTSAVERRDGAIR
jgi:dephospho-CoA kinase